MGNNYSIEELEKRLCELSNENNATYNEKLEHRIISGLLQRTSTLEDRVADLSNENNATYQYCVQIARAHNALCDALVSMSKSSPEFMSMFTDAIRASRIPNTNSAETGMELANQMEAQSEQDGQGVMEGSEASVDSICGSVGSDNCSGDINAQLEALRDKMRSYGEHTPIGNCVWDFLENNVRPHLEEWAQKVVELQGQLDACETANDYAIHEERQRTEKVSQLQEFHRKAEEQKAIIVRTSLMLSKENDALKAEVARLRESITSYLNVAESKAHYDSSTEWFTAIHRCEAKMKQALAEGGGE